MIMIPVCTWYGSKSTPVRTVVRYALPYVIMVGHSRIILFFFVGIAIAAVSEVRVLAARQEMSYV